MKPENNPKWFLIRADANKTVGLGHVMRCLALAQWAKDFNYSVVLLTKSPHLFLTQKLDQLGGELVLLDELNSPSSKDYQHSHWLKGSQLQDAKQTIDYVSSCKNLAPSFIVVDHYALGAPWESKLEEIAPVLAIDDLNDRQHSCTWLLDQTYGKTSDAYKKRAPNATFLIGSQYTLLRKEFSEPAAPSTQASEFRILVALGGADLNNDSLKVLKWLDNNTNSLEISILTTSLNPNLNLLREYCSKSTQYSLLVNEPDIVSVLLRHDLCVGAAGSSAWERCAMQLPTLMIETAQNQKYVASNLHKLGAAINLGDIYNITESKFNNALNDLISNPEKRKAIAHQGKKVCDGKGGLRVINAIEQHIQLQPDIDIRPATEIDVEYVHHLQCLPETRRFARNPNIPSLLDHSKWMRKKLQSQDDFFNIIEDTKGRKCGVIRLDLIDKSTELFEISIYLDPEFFGKGIAQRAIIKQIKQTPDKTILATVLPENEASQKLFSRCGFKQTDKNQFIYSKS
ncbi:MAG: UDP-2,4-diacetamido-2,4,6-trideoxy-beta-L-altropyranose hydrolase [Oleiphilaceae bacterium]|nr:UDP-2,4-diacetamido-2,4,6-trideoxy-beta-L-altropyranose hydrolase [Oleiphilaceae bacterium]